MKKGKSRRFRDINKVIEAYLPKLTKSQKGMGSLRSSEVAENIALGLAGDFRRKLKRG